MPYFVGTEATNPNISVRACYSVLIRSAINSPFTSWNRRVYVGPDLRQSWFGVDAATAYNAQDGDIAHIALRSYGPSGLEEHEPIEVVVNVSALLPKNYIHLGTRDLQIEFDLREQDYQGRHYFVLEARDAQRCRSPLAFAAAGT